jgi:hypothetical protein
MKKDDPDVTREDFYFLDDQSYEDAIQGLLEKGMIEVVECDGHPSYRITMAGYAYIQHCDSDPKTRN